MPHSRYEVAGGWYQVGPVQKSWLDDLGITPRTVIDCGSCDGADGVRYKSFWPEALVHCIEADPERFTIVKSMEPYGITAHHYAVGAMDGSIDFYRCWSKINGMTTSCGSLYRRRLSQRDSDIEFSDTPTAVPATRLDSFCRANGIASVDLLHVDVEGGELGVLQGLGAIRPRTMLLERSAAALQEGAPSYAEVYGLATSLGYCRVREDDFDDFFAHASAI